MYIVRYADDFKILCKNYNNARKAYIGIKEWLYKRLGLEINEDKSKITNIKKKGTEFLGFYFKLQTKNKKYIIQSHICEKAKKRIQNDISKRIMEIKKYPTGINAHLYNNYTRNKKLLSNCHDGKYRLSLHSI